jgi:hypothetical protein
LLHNEEKYTMLLGYESVDDVPFVSGTEGVITTTCMVVVPTQVIGKKVQRLVFGYVETAIRTGTLQTRETTPN